MTIPPAAGKKSWQGSHLSAVVGFLPLCHIITNPIIRRRRSRGRLHWRYCQLRSSDGKERLPSLKKSSLTLKFRYCDPKKCVNWVVSSTIIKWVGSKPRQGKATSIILSFPAIALSFELYVKEHWFCMYARRFKLRHCYYKNLCTVHVFWQPTGCVRTKSMSPDQKPSLYNHPLTWGLTCEWLAWNYITIKIPGKIIRCRHGKCKLGNKKLFPLNLY